MPILGPLLGETTTNDFECTYTKRCPGNSCGGFMADNQELCMFCLGYYKEPLGPIGSQYSTYKWVSN